MFRFHICFSFSEAEEKVNKMKEDYTKAKDREQSMVDEIDRLRKKIGFYESKSQHSSYLKKNKGKKSNFFKNFCQKSIKKIFKDSVNNSREMHIKIIKREMSLFARHFSVNLWSILKKINLINIYRIEIK